MYVCSFDAHPRAKVTCPHRERGYCPNCYEVYRFAQDRFEAAVRACPDCQAAEKAHLDRMQANETIDPSQPWGEHIDLTCKNHPDKRWSTKNIDYIGARSIFYRGEWGTECDCPGRDLVVAKGYVPEAVTS